MRPNDFEEQIVIKASSANGHFASEKILSNLAKFHSEIQQNFTVRFQQFIKLAFLPVDSKKTVLFKIATVATKLLPTKTMTQTTVAHPENVKHGPLSSLILARLSLKYLLVHRLIMAHFQNSSTAGNCVLDLFHGTLSLLFLKAHRYCIQRFVLNAVFHALLLAFNPISLLSLLQKLPRNSSDSQRKNTKAGLQFCTPSLSQNIPIPIFLLL